MRTFSENPFHYLPVCQHIGNTARNPKVVFQHGERAVRNADEVCADYRYINVVRNLYATHLTPKMFAGIDQLIWYDSIHKDLSFVIDIAKKDIQCIDALL